MTDDAATRAALATLRDMVDGMQLLALAATHPVPVEPKSPALARVRYRLMMDVLHRRFPDYLRAAEAERARAAALGPPPWEK